MKILLIGEYSNVHWTLAEGLRNLGHTVCVASNGDFWKNYRRDISLIRHSYNTIGGVLYMAKVYSTLPFLRGYDIVQIINPMFLELKAERLHPIYRYLRRNNKKIFMGAFGMDAYWVEYATKKPYNLRYSDFNIGNREITNEYTKGQADDWLETPKSRLNKYIANECNGIIAGMYEYHAAYLEKHAQKLTYIPFPIYSHPENLRNIYSGGRKVRFFIGIQRSRSVYKGTDIMLRALERLKADYPHDCEILRAENIPFKEYQKMIADCDVLLDQLYGYSPGMNALLALSNGKIVVGGAEEECYEILGEKSLRPMINVIPDEEDVYRKMEELLKHKEQIPQMQLDSIKYIERHHSPDKVARQYIKFWETH
ncbi:MAG: glycosyltransferase family 1 protein [Bacteroidaceae bacterium]|nr:glycosyltransferase family 1 protein [Bacteroidaceae bacterium]MBQ3539608.1 glycosyltransferase family 1 protein [Bacteroidaceae bacterium]